MNPWVYLYMSKTSHSIHLFHLQRERSPNNVYENQRSCSCTSFIYFIYHFHAKIFKHIVFQALHGVVRWSFRIVQLTSCLRFFVSSLTSSTNGSKSPPSPIWLEFGVQVQFHFPISTSLWCHLQPQTTFHLYLPMTYSLNSFFHGTPILYF